MKHLLSIFLVLFILASCTHKVTEKDAFIMSKQLVENSLKRKDLVFPFADYRFDDIKNGGYIIESHFEAKNQIGAKQKFNYRVKITYKEGSWSDVNNWKLEDIKIWE